MGPGKWSVEPSQSRHMILDFGRFWSLLLGCVDPFDQGLALIFI